MASLHADLSIPTAYLAVIYREKALPSRGEFESRDGNEKLYLVRTEQAACRFLLIFAAAWGLHSSSGSIAPANVNSTMRFEVLGDEAG